jgi:hypothetical protein
MLAFYLSVAYLFGTPDWRDYYLPAVHNYAIPGLATPPYALALFQPLSALGQTGGGLALAILNAAGLYLACRLVGGRFNWLLVSMPVMIVLIYGQLDGLVALGLVMGIKYARDGRIGLSAASLLLIGLKPHLGLVAGIIMLVKGRWSMIKPVLLTSGLVAVSGLAYSDRWLEWLSGLGHLPQFTGLPYNIGLFPWGLAVLISGLALGLHLPGLILAGLLSLPYVGYYSVIVVMVYRWPWWAYLLTWIALLGGHFIWLTVAVLVVYSYAKTKFKG